MTDTRVLVLAGILTGLAVLLQIVPAIFSEALAAVTLLSALPVYVIARARPGPGCGSP